MIADLQKQLHEVAANAQEMQPTNSKEVVYQAVVSLIYSIIEDEKLAKLYQALHLNFPEYFDNTLN